MIFFDRSYHNFYLSNDKNDTEQIERNLKNLVYYGIISDLEFEELTKRKYPGDPNEGKKGYFQCWECGTWQPVSKRAIDRTCGC